MNLVRSGQDPVLREAVKDFKEESRKSSDALREAVNKFSEQSSKSTTSIIRLTWVMVFLVAVQTIFLGLQVLQMLLGRPVL